MEKHTKLCPCPGCNRNRVAQGKNVKGYPKFQERGKVSWDGDWLPRISLMGLDRPRQVEL